jgi:hypothetical protein
MSYEQAISTMLTIEGVEESTLMKTPCLRYKGAFVTMMFDKADALIVKVSPERVNELISQGTGMEFNFTKKRFREWVMIPQEFQDEYEALMKEALLYAQGNMKK